MPPYCLSNPNYKTLVKMFAFCSNFSDEDYSDFTWREHLKPLLEELDRENAIPGSIIPPNRPNGGYISIWVDHLQKERKIFNPNDKLRSTVVLHIYNDLVEAKVVEAKVNPKTSLKWRLTRFLPFKRCNHR